MEFNLHIGFEKRAFLLMPPFGAALNGARKSAAHFIRPRDTGNKSLKAG